MMHLSVAVLEAIKNKAYSLRPLEQMPYNKRHGIKRDLSMAEIIARRMAMAMGYREEEENAEDDKH